MSVVRRAARWARRQVSRVDAAASSLLPDRLFHAHTFRREFGRRLNLEDPRTLNEKIIWLMLNYRRPLLTRLADKYEARGYVAEKIGPEYLNELYGIWEHPDEIDFDRLPATFVLKISSGFKMNVYCRDRATFDPVLARRQLREWLRRPHHRLLREWAYKDARRRIMAERLLGDDRYLAPTNYNIMCFNGTPRYIEVHTGRFVDLRVNAVDLDWQRLPFTVNAHNFPPRDEPIPRPSNLEEMIRCAARLSEEVPLLRVDLYSIQGRTIFGELTVYPSAGRRHYAPSHWDHYWGEALKLPEPYRG